MSKFDKIQQAVMTGTPIEKLEDTTNGTPDKDASETTSEQQAIVKASTKNELNAIVTVGKKKPTSSKKTISLLIEEQNANYLKKKAKSLNHSASSFINELLTSMRHNEE